MDAYEAGIRFCSKPGDVGKVAKVDSSGCLTLDTSSQSGDTKTSYLTVDQDGWIKLNGRAKTTLTTSQQAAATSLGIGTNLPLVASSLLGGLTANSYIYLGA